jgi:hypothetical protein
MEFRWIGLIALWTLLSGPIFHSTVANRVNPVADAKTASTPIAKPAAR